MLQESEELALFESGYDLDSPIAEKLKNKEPLTSTERLILLGYHYSRKKSGFKNQYMEFIRWFIENEPESSILQYQSLNERDTDYQQLKHLWIRNLRKYWGKATVLENASSFLSLFNDSISELLLRRAIALEPSDAKLHRKLAELCKDRALSRSMHRDNLVRNALDSIFQALIHQKNRADPFLELYMQDFLNDFGEFALSFEQYSDAEKIASELIRVRPKRIKRLTWDNVEVEITRNEYCAHRGLALLGRAKLARMARLEAIQVLEKMGSEPLPIGSLDLKLATALLSIGERQKVREYLEICKKQAQEELAKFESSPPKLTGMQLAALRKLRSNKAKREKLIGSWKAPLERTLETIDQLIQKCGEP